MPNNVNALLSPSHIERYETGDVSQVEQSVEQSAQSELWRAGNDAAPVITFRTVALNPGQTVQLCGVDPYRIKLNVSVLTNSSIVMSSINSSDDSVSAHSAALSALWLEYQGALFATNTGAAVDYATVTIVKRNN